MADLLAEISGNGAEHRSSRYGRALIYSALFGWSFVCLFPLYWLAIASLKDESSINNGPFYVPFVDFEPTLSSWRFILADPYEHLLGPVANSLIVAIVSSALVLLISGLTVYSLSRFRLSMPFFLTASLVLASMGGAGLVVLPTVGMKSTLIVALAALMLAAFLIRSRVPAVGGGGLLAVILSTRLLAPMVVALPLYMMFSQVGLVDTRLALIATYTAINLPVGVWLLLPVFGPLATEQEEAARLEGASHLRIVLAILLPMLASTIAAVGLLLFVLCWNEYLFAAFLGSNNALTLPSWMAGQVSIKEAQVGSEAEETAHLAAATVLMAVPLLAAASMIQRFLGRRFAQVR